jgi:hippurate hydrolase
MPIINRVADLADEITVWRRAMHENPELQYDVHWTAAQVAEKLKAFGCDEVVTGIGRTGVVGVIRGRKSGSGKVVGMRADMDALPIEEATDLPYKSKVKGKMHACGHDGHTAMLLGAAKYLAETRNFDGTAVMIFQPAEEGGGGGKAMVDDGLMTRFGVQEVYGMHNMPGMPVGHFAIRPGPMMASADRFDLIIEGKGAHAARPHDGIDTVVVTSQIILALQTIASRNVDPIDSIVVSVCMVKGGETYNVIPQTVHVKGTVRALLPATRDYAQKRIDEIVNGLCAAHGATATITYDRGYPVTINDADKTETAVAVARDVVGAQALDLGLQPLMGSEDFSFMLEERPGAYILVGNGDTAGVHHPAYDFNDKAIPFGVSYWARLAELTMPA